MQVNEFLKHTLQQIYEAHYRVKCGIALGINCVGNFDIANEGYNYGFYIVVQMYIKKVSLN